MPFAEDKKPPRILAFDAHPDDCDIMAGGSAILWAQAGCAVRFVSVTNGEVGHHQISGKALVERRRAEAQAAGHLAGIEYWVLDNPDGQLMPGLEERFALIRLIREFRPNLILTHRPNDYHPDHRYTSQLVQDCSYLINVPHICPDSPRMDTVPVFAYFRDHFQKPIPFHPDVAIDIDPVFETKIRMLDCHASQVYEWLPWMDRHHLKPAETPELKRQELIDFMRISSKPDAKTKETLIRLYGNDHGSNVIDAECFEACEYGAVMDAAAIRRLFPF